MAEEQEKRAEENNKEKGIKETGSSGNRIVLISILAGVLIINTLIAFFLIQATKPPSKKKLEEKARADSLKQTMILETTIGAIADPPIEAIVNIAGTDGMRFLKVVVALEYDDKEYKNLGEELNRRHVKLKDMLLEQLSTMTLEDLNDIEARNQIRKVFMRHVNKSLPADVGQISNVYINEFIIQ